MANTIYTNNANRKVTLNVPVVPIDGTVDIEVYEQGLIVHTVQTVALDVDSNLFFNLPFSLTHTDKELEVNWVFNYNEAGSIYEYNNRVQVNVVTPILPLVDIRKIVGDQFSEDEMYDIEKAVRNIIQSHTGQFFGKFIGKKTVSGSGESNLRLPGRLMKLTSINGNIYWNQMLALRGAGWFLQNKAHGIPSIRADFDGWHENPWTSTVPIGINMFNFIEHAEYEINGVWGWNSVPEAVQEAAKLLINDYACGDNNYRDRFLTSMTAADWRLQFHEGAFSNTGNVRANQLLAEYVLRRGWVVI